MKDLEVDLNIQMEDLYKGEEIITEDKLSSIIKKLKTKQGRNIFLKILINNHSDKGIREFRDDSFNAFEEIFTKVLSLIPVPEEKDNNKENLFYFMKIFKICGKIKLIEKNEENKKVSNTLDNIIYNKFRIPTLINNERFWEIWVDDDLTKEDLQIKKLIEEKKNIDKATLGKFEPKLKEIIYNLIFVMLKLNMEGNAIQNYIKHLCEKYLLNEEIQKDMNRNINVLLSFYEDLI